MNRYSPSPLAFDVRSPPRRDRRWSPVVACLRCCPWLASGGKGPGEGRPSSAGVDSTSGVTVGLRGTTQDRRLARPRLGESEDEVEPWVVVVGGLVAFRRSSHGWVTSPWSPRTPNLPFLPPGPSCPGLLVRRFGLWPLPVVALVSQPGTPASRPPRGGQPEARLSHSAAVTGISCIPILLHTIAIIVCNSMDVKALQVCTGLAFPKEPNFLFPARLGYDRMVETSEGDWHGPLQEGHYHTPR